MIRFPETGFKMLVKLCAAWALCVLPAAAFQEPAAQGDAKKDGEADTEKKKDDEEHWFVVRNAEIHTGTGLVLRDAMLLAKNGKIEEIGHDLEVPDVYKRQSVGCRRRPRKSRDARHDRRARTPRSRRFDARSADAFRAEAHRRTRRSHGQALSLIHI